MHSVSETLKENFSNHFSKYGSLTNDEKTAIHESMIVRKFPRDFTLVNDGEVLRETYYVLQGLIRRYTLLDGEDTTTAFYTENQWILSPGDGMLAAPFSGNLVCMEETLVVVGNEQSAIKLFANHPRFESVARSIVQEALFQQERFHTTWITQTPEQRYVSLSEQRPDLLQRVSQYHIASYIGIKPESLSRIRKRIATQK